MATAVYLTDAKGVAPWQPAARSACNFVLLGIIVCWPIFIYAQQLSALALVACAVTGLAGAHALPPEAPTVLRGTLHIAARHAMMLLAIHADTPALVVMWAGPTAGAWLMARLWRWTTLGILVCELEYPSQDREITAWIVMDFLMVLFLAAGVQPATGHEESPWQRVCQAHGGRCLT